MDSSIRRIDFSPDPRFGMVLFDLDLVSIENSKIMEFIISYK